METKTIRIMMKNGETKELDAEITRTKLGIARFSHPGKKTKYGNIQKFIDSRFKGQWHSIIPTLREYNVKYQAYDNFGYIKVLAENPTDALNKVIKMGYNIVCGVYDMDGELVL